VSEIAQRERPGVAAERFRELEACVLDHAQSPAIPLAIGTTP
jgi:hypothetical protein